MKACGTLPTKVVEGKGSREVEVAVAGCWLVGYSGTVVVIGGCSSRKIKHHRQHTARITLDFYLLGWQYIRWQQLE